MIHRPMSDLARDGLAIVMISCELRETLGMSDRIAVMHGRTIIGELDCTGRLRRRSWSWPLGRRSPPPR